MAVYYVWSGATGTGTGASWANAFIALNTAFGSGAAGDTFYVAHDHVQAAAGALFLTSPGNISNPVKVICVNRAGTVPPVSADRRTTAQISTPLNNAMTFDSPTHYDGIIFIAGTSTGSGGLNLQNTGGHWTRFDNCSLRLGGTSTGATIAVGTTAVYVELNNTTVSFANVSQKITVGAVLKWRNTASALLGTIPDLLFQPNNTTGGEIECIGVDFSAAGSGKTILGTHAGGMAQKHKFIDCKLNAAVTKTIVPGSQGATEADFIRSGATGNYTVFRHRAAGSLEQETTIVRTTGGATDGTTKISWKVITTTKCFYSLPFECPPIAVWNDTTGSAKTATVECIGAAIATDQDVWLELEYLGDAASPQGSFVNDAKTDLLATAVNQTTSTEAWGGSTAAFKLAVTFTPQQKGWVYCRVKVGKASSTYYIDPLVTLT